MHFLICSAVFCAFSFKVEKCAIMTFNKFLDKKSRKVPKNEEFHADFKLKKCTKQQL